MSGSDLPPRVVVGANGAYWRDYGDGYSMPPVSTDNDPVEPVAVYSRVKGTVSFDGLDLLGQPNAEAKLAALVGVVRATIYVYSLEAGVPQPPETGRILHSLRMGLAVIGVPEVEHVHEWHPIRWHGTEPAEAPFSDSCACGAVRHPDEAHRWDVADIPSIRPERG